ncbi:probable helicase senataxin [Culicoides brevitarsis]|uniref:probable helicase senataxin n=1 Tax=Culicoides brevitarsis TaxID=469753 RepID=UPI00307C5A2F
MPQKTFKKYTNFRIRRYGYSLTSRHSISKIIPVDGLIIGREEDYIWNQLSLSLSGFVSRKHCRIFCKNDKIYLEDYSKKGTWVNGIKIHHSTTELKEGDVFSLGKKIDEKLALDSLKEYSFIVESLIKREKDEKITENPKFQVPQQPERLSTQEMFNYLANFTPIHTSEQLEEAYPSTQDLLHDLNASNEASSVHETPPTSPQETEINQNLHEIEHEAEISSKNVLQILSEPIHKEVQTEEIPQNPLNLREILKNADLNEILNHLLNIHGFEVMEIKFKELKAYVNDPNSTPQKSSDTKNRRKSHKEKKSRKDKQVESPKIVPKLKINLKSLKNLPQIEEPKPAKIRNRRKTVDGSSVKPQEIAEDPDFLRMLDSEVIKSQKSSEKEKRRHSRSPSEKEPKPAKVKRSRTMHEFDRNLELTPEKEIPGPSMFDKSSFYSTPKSKPVSILKRRASICPSEVILDAESHENSSKSTPIKRKTDSTSENSSKNQEIHDEQPSTSQESKPAAIKRRRTTICSSALPSNDEISSSSEVSVPSRARRNSINDSSTLFQQDFSTFDRSERPKRDLGIEFSQIILRPVPPAKDYVDIYRKEELPPSLDEVPDYSTALKKSRIAHNRAKNETETKEEVPKIPKKVRFEDVERNEKSFEEKMKEKEPEIEGTVQKTPKKVRFDDVVVEIIPAEKSETPKKTVEDVPTTNNDEKMEEVQEISNEMEEMDQISNTSIENFVLNDPKIDEEEPSSSTKDTDLRIFAENTQNIPALVEFSPQNIRKSPSPEISEDEIQKEVQSMLRKSDTESSDDENFQFQDAITTDSLKKSPEIIKNPPLIPTPVIEISSDEFSDAAVVEKAPVPLVAEIGDVLNRLKDYGVIPPNPAEPETSELNTSNEILEGVNPPCPEVEEQNLAKDPRLQDGIQSAMRKPKLPKYDTKKILADVLQWEVDWLTNGVDGIVEKWLSKHSGVTDTFDSVNCYINTFSTLLKVETLHRLAETNEKHWTSNSKQFAINVCKQNKFTINKFDFSAISSYRCEFTSRNHSKFINDLKKGLLVSIGGTCTRKKYFGYITRVSDFRENHVSDLNIIVADKFRFESNRNVTIRILYNVMKMLDMVVNLEEIRESPLLPLILNPKNIKIDLNVVATSDNAGMDRLDPDQFETTSLITNKIEWDRFDPHIFLVDGAAGTGKTRTITNMVMHLLRNPDVPKKDYRILICAPGKSATGMITNRLIRCRDKLEADEKQILRFVSFSEQVELHGMEDERSTEEIRAEIDKIQMKIEKFKNYELVLDLEHAIRALSRKQRLQDDTFDFNLCNNFTKREILEEANVIICDVTDPNIFFLANSKTQFDVIIVDEATKITEIATSLLLNFNSHHLILFGDKEKHPLTIRNEKAREMGLGNSLFHRIAKVLPSIPCLKRQHRMRSDVLKFNNDYFYGNKVISTCGLVDPSYKIAPYLVFELESVKSYNVELDGFVVDLVKAIKEQDHSHSIGILATCKQQKSKLSAIFCKQKFSSRNISLQTIQEAEGQEKDIIIFCCTPCSDEGLEVLFETTLVNVALTRARKSLFVCGNFHTLKRNKFWEKFVQDAKNRNVYIDTTLDNLLSLKNFILQK